MRLPPIISRLTFTLPILPQGMAPAGMSGLGLRGLCGAILDSRQEDLFFQAIGRAHPGRAEHGFIQEPTTVRLFGHGYRSP